MKLPSEYVAMLEEHCAKLEEIEDWLYEQWKATEEKETADLWLQAQQQLRLTAHVFLDSIRPEVRFTLRTLSPPKSSFVGRQERGYHWRRLLDRTLVNARDWPKYHPLAIKADTHRKVYGTASSRNLHATVLVV